MSAPRPALREVAAAAGVSVCTASKAVRYVQGVAPATAARVRAVAKGMGYVPDIAARSLKSQTSTTIGMLFSNTQSRYYGSVLPAVNAAAHQRGFTVIFGDSVDSLGVPQVDLERAVLTSLVSNRVAGVILVSPQSVDSIETLKRWNIPVVVLDSAAPEMFPEACSVAADNAMGARLAGEHLVEHGYRSFVFVGHSSTWSTRREREDGFLGAVAPYGKTDVIEGGFTTDAAEAAVLSHLATRSDPPDAIFTSNDVMLTGTILALKHRGLRPGDDVAIASFDEFEWAPMIDPPITTVDQHISRLGRLAAEEILDLVEGGTTPETENVIRLQPELVIRESCGCGR